MNKDIANVFSGKDENTPFCEGVVGSNQKVLEFGRFFLHNAENIHKLVEVLNYAETLDKKNYSEDFHTGLRRFADFLQECYAESGLMEKQDEKENDNEKEEEEKF